VCFIIIFLSREVVKITTMVNIYYNNASLQHKLYPLFSEKPRRFEALIDFFSKEELPLISSRVATKEEVARAHKQDYIEHVESISKQGFLKALITNTFSNYVQWYTRVSKGSYHAAFYAAGSVCQAVEDVLNNKCGSAFCLVRPPGHHAGVEKGEGFCLFNNVAIGALSAVENNAKKVAIIDFDRHHGNGTEEIIRKYGRDNILFISSYQDGCKYYHDQPQDKNIISIPIPEHSEFSSVRTLYEEKVVTALYLFKPDLIMLSAGFDMHVDDPLTNIKLESKDFFTLTEMIVSAAKELCEGRIVSCLEGGYDVRALKECAENHIDALGS